MEINVLLPPADPIIQVLLKPNESFKAESTSFVSMTDGVQAKTRMLGGQIRIFSSNLRDQEFFINTYRAVEKGGEVLISPSFPGSVTIHELENSSLLVQPGAFLASEEGVKIDKVWHGGSSISNSEGLNLLRCSGNGKLIFSSYGAMYEKKLEEDEGLIIDTGHLVALDERLFPRIRQLGGGSNLILGEEQVLDLNGPGAVFLQSRSRDILIQWVKNQIK